jgi:fumagillin biosynthesis methyltransferase
MPVALHMPKHLGQTAYEEPTEAKNAAYIKMPENEEALTFFTRCRWKPEYQESFVGCMSNITAWKQDWTEYFDTNTIFDESVRQNAEKSPILVDVGGNAGVDVMRFLSKHPDVPAGSLVLQDVGDVIAMARVDDKIRPMTHDFFTAQTVVDSRVYFLHSILHDWPDDLALTILRHLVPAFKKGYSKLLIADVVIPAHGASVMQAAHDLCLMSLLSAVERTEAAWRQLLSTAGFRVVRVWNDTRGIESVIEAELADNEPDEVESNVSDE